MNYFPDTLLVFFSGLSHFCWSAKEIVFEFMVHILFSWASCPFILIQNRTPLLILFPHFMIFILPAGICSGIIYWFSEGH